MIAYETLLQNDFYPFSDINIHKYSDINTYNSIPITHQIFLIDFFMITAIIGIFAEFFKNIFALISCLIHSHLHYSHKSIFFAVSTSNITTVCVCVISFFERFVHENVYAFAKTKWCKVKLMSYTIRSKIKFIHWLLFRILTQRRTPQVYAVSNM